MGYSQQFVSKSEIKDFKVSAYLPIGQYGDVISIKLHLKKIGLVHGHLYKKTITVEPA